MIKKTILVVDDDEDLCQGVAAILAHEGYLVECTSNVIEAEAFINSRVFDIGLFDYKMPISSGVELVKKIKAKNPSTKAFIMSGRPFIEKTIEDENASMLVDGIIKKPFSDTVLLEKIGY